MNRLYRDSLEMYGTVRYMLGNAGVVTESSVEELVDKILYIRHEKLQKHP